MFDLGSLTNELVLAGATALVLGAASLVARRGSAAARRARRQARRSPEPRAVAACVIDRARGAGMGKDLYCTEAVCPGTVLPMLVRPSWLGPHAPDRLFDATQMTRSTVAVDHRLLEELHERDGIPLRHDDGQPWDDLIVRARAITDEPRILLGTASYYQFLSTCGALSMEAEEATRRSERRSWRLRDRYLSTWEQVSSCAAGANGMGCNVVTTLSQGSQATVLVQKRSTNVAVHPGTYNVAPVFGCVPHRRPAGYAFDLVSNVVREYLEEFHDFDDIQFTTDRKHLDPLWFMRTPEARFLTDRLASGSARLAVMGVGVDLQNGEVDIACWLDLEVDDALDDVVATMRTNWEYQSVEQYDLTDPAIDSFVDEGRFQPGGAMALDLVRQAHAARPG